MKTISLLILAALLGLLVTQAAAAPATFESPIFGTPGATPPKSPLATPPPDAAPRTAGAIHLSLQPIGADEVARLLVRYLSVLKLTLR